MMDSFGDFMMPFSMADEICRNLAALQILAHLPLDKMAAISQTIFSDAFSRMKILYFDINFIEFRS